MSSVQPRSFYDDIMDAHTSEMVCFRQEPLVDKVNLNLISQGNPCCGSLDDGLTKLARLIEETKADNDKLLLVLSESGKDYEARIGSKLNIGLLREANRRFFKEDPAAWKLALDGGTAFGEPALPLG